MESVFIYWPKLSFTGRVEKVPKPWNESFVHARERMVERLYCVTPTVLKVLYLWHFSFKYVCCETRLSQTNMVYITN